MVAVSAGARTVVAAAPTAILADATAVVLETNPAGKKAHWRPYTSRSGAYVRLSVSTPPPRYKSCVEGTLMLRA
jgi:hypothetical protein